MHLFEEKEKAFRLKDFEDMFSQWGLHILEVFGVYDWHSFHTKDSPRLVMLAVKG